MEITKMLFEQAKTVRDNAYAPYSKYKVGAAIYAKSKKIYVGCNVENVSFPCGTCAEAGAIASMIAGGDKEIISILIIADGKNLVYPCGACLQRIAEFSNKKTKIYLADMEKVRKIYTLKELLPYGFKEDI